MKRATGTTALPLDRTRIGGGACTKRRAQRGGVVGVAAVLAGLVLGGCASGRPAPSDASVMSPASSAATLSGSVAAGPTVVFHGLRVSGGYVPQPSSPDVAAAYLTIDNTTAHRQRLTKVVTNVTKSVMTMNETDTGSVGSMTDLSKVTIPAHGEYRFLPNHAHLMLEHPQHLIAGDRVTMTLTFSPAGSVIVLLPVVPIGETPQQAPSSYRATGGTSNGSMPSMPGVSVTSGG